MKKRLFFLMLISMFAFKLQAQETRKGTAYYKGTINGDLKIVMSLEYRREDYGTFYKGWYYYESQGESQKIPLSGEWRAG